MLMGLPSDSDAMTVSLDYCDTVNSNIELFLKDKPNRMTFSLETPEKTTGSFGSSSVLRGIWKQHCRNSICPTMLRKLPGTK